jgi:hypothetical protein
MKKIRKEFTFNFPLKHNVVRNLKVVTETICLLEVECVGYYDPTVSKLNIHDRYSVDIDFIRYEGKDIKPILDVTELMDDIEQAALLELASITSSKLDLGKAFDIFKKAI